ncbi:MAG: 2OG-Fe(II) oxygenase family protein [Betaproteobacteria bacterium]|nr:2OG-Fe(II) oxygenase family protein [Betaproteobacteria bacterium]
MFPTLVWKVQIEAGRCEAINAAILAAVARIRPEAPLAAGQGWQSGQALHQLEELRDLNACVERSARSVLRFLKIAYDDLEITACWANILARGAAHKAHSHPNNFLSGVYYVQTDPAIDAINFHDPRSQTAVIRPPVAELTAENTDQVVVRVRNGMLLLFPSYLEHSVDANAGENERISVSFNIMFSAFTEKLAKPLW